MEVKKFGFALALLVVAPGISLAAGDVSCQQPMASMPDNFLKLMDRIDELVTIVPPEEGRYIDAEYAATMRVKSTARMDALMRRPMFFPHQLHVAVQSGRDIARMLSVGTLTPKSKVQTASFLPFHIVEIKDAFGELLDHDNARTVNRDDAGHANLQLVQALNDVQQYVSCWADRI